MRSLKRHDTAEAIRMSIESDRCIPVDIRIVGADPGNGAVRGVVVYRLPDNMMHRDGMYVVADCWDYTACGDTSARRVGLDIRTSVFGASRTDALRMSAERVGHLMSDYTWFVPGTQELVPGCWGYME